MCKKGIRGEEEGWRDFIHVARYGNGYTTHITDCYYILAGFYKALKILFVIKFPSTTPIPSTGSGTSFRTCMIEDVVLPEIFNELAIYSTNRFLIMYSISAIKRDQIFT